MQAAEMASLSVDLKYKKHNKIYREILIGIIASQTD